jgi:hypothetical protein
MLQCEGGYRSDAASLSILKKWRTPHFLAEPRPTALKVGYQIWLPANEPSRNCHNEQPTAKNQAYGKYVSQALHAGGRCACRNNGFSFNPAQEFGIFHYPVQVFQLLNTWIGQLLAMQSKPFVSGSRTVFLLKRSVMVIHCAWYGLAKKQCTRVLSELARFSAIEFSNRRLFFAGFIRLHTLHHADEGPICRVDIVAELARPG